MSCVYGGNPGTREIQLSPCLNKVGVPYWKLLALELEAPSLMRVRSLENTKAEGHARYHGRRVNNEQP